MSLGRDTARREAFTLVELLVVVAITGVLVAMLVPSLKRAREQACRTVCSSNQHQIIVAFETYAHDYASLPIMNRQGLDINYRKITGQWVRQEINGFGPETWDEYLDGSNFWTGSPFRGIIFQVDISSSMNANNFGKWRNFGMLYNENSLPDPKGMFCPSQREPTFAWDNPMNPWPPRVETARRPDKPYLANHTASGYERRLGLTGVPWDRISPRTAMVTDRLLRPLETEFRDDTGIIDDAHKSGINAAYRDGHISFLQNRRILDWLPEGSTFYSARKEAMRFYNWLDSQFAR